MKSVFVIIEGRVASSVTCRESIVNSMQLNFSD